MLERRNVRGGRKNGLKIRIIDRFINSIKFPFEFQGGLGNIFQHFQRSNKMIDNEQRRETWQRYGNRPSSSLTSDIPSNESPTSPPKLFLRSVASYSASIIILFSRYRLCKNIFIFTRVCLYIYIYILNFFVICLAHGERPLQHVESRLTVANTLHREDNPWFQRVCVTETGCIHASLFITTYVYFIHIYLLYIYIYEIIHAFNRIKYIHICIIQYYITRRGLLTYFDRFQNICLAIQRREECYAELFDESYIYCYATFCVIDHEKKEKRGKKRKRF